MKSKKNEEEIVIGIETLSDEVKFLYMKVLIVFAFLDDQQIDSAEVSELQILMTQLAFSAKLRHRARECILEATDLSLADSISELIDTVPEDMKRNLSVSIVKDCIRVHNATKEDCSLESEHIHSVTLLLGVSKEELEFVEAGYQMDQKLMDGDIKESEYKSIAKDLASKATAVGLPVAAIYMSGSVLGLSATGMTSGLAALGVGGVLGLSSMVTGIGSVVLIGVVAYRSMRWALNSSGRNKETRRELMLQEVLGIHQKTISNLAEDVNYLAQKVIEAMRDTRINEAKISKLASYLELFTSSMTNLKVKERKVEDKLIEEIGELQK
jgi:hypothetical protein